MEGIAWGELVFQTGAWRGCLVGLQDAPMARTGVSLIGICWSGVSKLGVSWTVSLGRVSLKRKVVEGFLEDA